MKCLFDGPLRKSAMMAAAAAAQRGVAVVLAGGGHTNCQVGHGGVAGGVQFSMKHRARERRVGDEKLAEEKLEEHIQEASNGTTRKI